MTDQEHIERAIYHLKMVGIHNATDVEHMEITLPRRAFNRFWGAMREYIIQSGVRSKGDEFSLTQFLYHGIRFKLGGGDDQ